MTDLLLKCVCAGSHGVGKTSIITRYIHNTFNSHHSSTIGIEFNLRQIQLQDGRTIRLQLWEMAPQREFKTITTGLSRFCFLSWVGRCASGLQPREPRLV
eukprot:TRINITY_DN4353_c0_g1_i7.p2 TRINITY_DN4353_c0_g1~~TRINITY_DN4353_c0_g1_i7.p2  ORF type:complete len:100 (+),score=10.58 TRINITY_DN4353_c0_g1_i7:3-302(+)